MSSSSASSGPKLADTSGPDLDPGDRTAPTLGEIERLADVALGQIPKRLRARAQGVAIRVEDFPDEETLNEMGAESAFDLLGLYRGVSLDHKGSGDIVHDVDLIFLYRRPILDFWCEGEDSLGAVVRHVLVHEIGHHFGLSDDEMEAIESTVED